MRGRPRALRNRLRFQILRVQFEISADDPAVLRELRFLVQSARQPEPPGSTVSYEIASRDGAYLIARNGVQQDVQFDPPAVLDSVHRLVQREALDAWPDAALLLRAAVGRWNGERFVVAGEKLWDRSRLALWLLARGAEVECDELAILHDGLLTSYPRPFRVWDRGEPLPPGTPPLEELPSYRSTWSRSWALDLGTAGIDWKVSTDAVERVILLEANYGGQTSMRDLPAYEAARILMSHAHAIGDIPDAMRATARLLNTARCQALWLGSLEDIAGAWPLSPRDRLRAG